MGPIHAWEHNLLGKMMPTFCPMGPCIATRDECPIPDDVKIVTRLNGQVMQDANTDDLVFSVAKLIEYYSQFYRFHARRLHHHRLALRRRLRPQSRRCS